MSSQERRSFPRITDEGVSLKLHAGGFDAVAHTLNLSASGMYCKVPKEIPLMSRVRLMLEIPDPSNKNRPVNNLDVEGVVVREHPVIIDGEIKHYDCAIFFDNLSPKSGDIIANYIAGKKS